MVGVDDEVSAAPPPHHRPTMTGPLPPAEVAAGSCRSCPVWCDRVVEPAGCIESSCPMLYVHEASERRFFGCMRRIFEVEVDLDRFQRAERTRLGFGGLRVAREPLPICRVAIAPSHPDRAERPCLEPDFLFSAAVPPQVDDGGWIEERGEA